MSLPEEIPKRHVVRGKGAYHVPEKLSRSHMQVLNVLARSQIPLKAKWLRTLVTLKSGSVAGRLSELLKLDYVRIANRKERPFSYMITERGLKILKQREKSKRL